MADLEKAAVAMAAATGLTGMGINMPPGSIGGEAATAVESAQAEPLSEEQVEEQPDFADIDNPEQ